MADDSWMGQGANTVIDDWLANQAFMTMKTPGSGSVTTRVLFQFPPYIKSDTKGGDWTETVKLFAEPMVMYSGGKPREIDLEWTYVVTGQVHSKVVWNASHVSQVVKFLRSYFYGQIGDEAVINFFAYDVVGVSDRDPQNRDPSDYWTFRADSISVSHEGSLIVDESGIYPLCTKIGMKLKFFTTLQVDYSSINNVTPVAASDPGLLDKLATGVGKGLSGGGAAAAPAAQPQQIKVSSLKPSPNTLAWF